MGSCGVQFLLEAEGDGVWSNRPVLDLNREFGQIVVSGHVRFGEEGHGMVETCYRRSLMIGSQVDLGGSLHNSLPDLSAKGLVGVRHSGELCLHPGVRSVLLGFGLLIDIQDASVQNVVGALDLLDSSVRSVDDVSAQIVQLSDVNLGLLVLMNEGSYPTGWLGNLVALGDFGATAGDL
jgi:hypothetical protein